MKQFLSFIVLVFFVSGSFSPIYAQKEEDLKETIEKAKALRQEEKLEESEELLLSLLEEYPDDPQVLFEVGGSYDVMGYETEAIPHYQRAIAEGLEGSELLECLICLGINHRAIGDFQEAVDTLEEAIDTFPEDNGGKTNQYQKIEGTDYVIPVILYVK